MLLRTAAFACFLLAASPVALLRPGLYHKGEVTARPGADWLGLVADAPGGRYAWRRCAVETEPAADPLVDQDSERTGVEVKAQCAAPLVLVRGLDRLEGAPVETALVGKRMNEPLELKLPSGVYQLSSAQTVVLRTKEARQTLHDWPTGTRDPRCEIVWAGDLDGDGRLDLLLVLSSQGTAVETTLYLSSAASPVRLVEAVARLRTAGE